MFGIKQKAAETWPAHEFQNRLSVLLSAARTAGVTPWQIADKLEAQARSIRLNIAINCPAGMSVY